jgi:AhpD family alkylhydroperoxidase
MPRIPAHTLDDTPKATHDTLAALHKRYGKILNIHGGMAHSPVVLAAYTGVQTAIAEHGSFNARTQEAIALTVGATNQCAYCQAAHTTAARSAGLSPDEALAARTGTPIEPRLDALLAVARQATTTRGEVDEPTWQQALDAGWTVENLTELFAHVMANMFTNYFNHYADTELDLPAAPPTS